MNTKVQSIMDAVEKHRCAGCKVEHAATKEKLQRMLEEALAESAQESEALRGVVGTVLEGFTLPPTVRKILETSYYATYTAPKPHPKQDSEPVAWMYQCSADKSGPVLMEHKQDWAESGSGLWKETPLYTAPQPQPQPLTVPQGWKLVPLEPTEEMLLKADGLTCIDFRALGECGAFDLEKEITSIYRAMYGAAPEAPAVQPDGDER